MRFLVMCQVSGGTTGTRIAPLKQKDGIRFFESRQEAQDVATELMENQNRDPYRTASFRYWVEGDETNRLLDEAAKATGAGRDWRS